MQGWVTQTFLGVKAPKPAPWSSRPVGATLTVTALSQEAWTARFRPGGPPEPEPRACVCSETHSLPCSALMRALCLPAWGAGGDGVKYLLRTQPSVYAHVWTVCFFNRLSTKQCVTSYFFSLTSLTCCFSSFVQILKAHHFGAKMNKTWLLYDVGN